MAEGVLTAESLASAFRDIAARHPNRVALSEPGWKCSFAELDDLSDRCATAFLRLGLARHGRVIFQLPNGRDLIIIIALLGWLKAELIPVRGGVVPGDAARTSALLQGAPLFPLFGMTEGLLSCGCIADPPELLNTTVGTPLSAYDEGRIIDPDTGLEMPDGTEGELIVRGPCTIRGYVNAEARNREAFTAEGFYRSGDLMRFVHAAGKRCLVFCGRLKDVVSRGGEKINSQEVEQLVIRHPAVGAVAIVPVPDAAYGERACAVIIPAIGAEPVGVAEPGRFLEGLGVATFKWPEFVEIVEDFPVTSSGKLSKLRLTEIIKEKRKQALLF